MMMVSSTIIIDDDDDDNHGHVYVDMSDAVHTSHSTVHMSWGKIARNLTTCLALAPLTRLQWSLWVPLRRLAPSRVPALQ